MKINSIKPFRIKGNEWVENKTKLNVKYLKNMGKEPKEKWNLLSVEDVEWKYFEYMCFSVIVQRTAGKTIDISK